MRRGRFRPSHPPFKEAVRHDVVATLRYRSEPYGIGSSLDLVGKVIRLSLTTDAFFAQLMYRVKTALQSRSIPVLPRVAHRLAMISAQVCIGDPVVIQPGLYLPHGQVVVDGITVVGRDVVIAPWTTIGLTAGNFVGPTVGDHVNIGTGARLIGPIRVGAHAQVGANAVVIADVPDGCTAVGVPARTIERRAASDVAHEECA